MQPKEGEASSKEMPMRYEHSEDDEAFSDEEIGCKSYPHRQAQYREAPLQEMDAKAVFSAHYHGPGVAKGEGDPTRRRKRVAVKRARKNQNPEANSTS